MDTAVAVVKAYLELCGYFVLAELPVRGRDKRGYHDVTDIDILAVRFLHEPHPLKGPMAQPLHVLLGKDPELGTFEDGLDVIVGEVKESRARLNPPLQRRQTVAFALRRVGCCPEETVEEEPERVIQEGQREHWMPGGMRCCVRLVVFAGYKSSKQKAARYVSLDHCASFIAGRFREGRDVLGGAQFKDSVLGLFALQDKLARFAELQEQEAPSKPVLLVNSRWKFAVTQKAQVGGQDAVSQRPGVRDADRPEYGRRERGARREEVLLLLSRLSRTLQGEPKAVRSRSVNLAAPPGLFARRWLIPFSFAYALGGVRAVLLSPRKGADSLIDGSRDPLIVSS